MNKNLIHKAIYWFVGIITATNLIYSIMVFYNPDTVAFASGSSFLFIENIIIILLSSAIVFIHYYFPSVAGQIAGPDADNPDHLVYTDSLLVDKIPGILCIKDAKCRWLHADTKYLKFFNIGSEDYFGKTNTDLINLPAANFDALCFDASQDINACKKQKKYKDEDFKLSADNTLYEIDRIPLYDMQNRLLRLIITGTPVNSAPISTAHPAVQQEQTVSEELNKIFAVVFFTSPLPFLLLDSEFRVILVNKSFITLTGYSEEEALSKKLFSMGNKSVEDSEIYNLIKSFFQNNAGEVWSKELYSKNKSGKEFPARINISPIEISYSGKKNIPKYVANIFDITQQKLNEKRIMQIANYDDLTGLPNRIMFCHRLGEALSAAKRHKASAVVLFLDLDRFKSVNDSLGHQAGDELLKESAKRIVENVRREDVVSRLSGDEFAILLLNEKSHETAIYSATIVAEKIIASLSSSFYIQRQEIFIGVSIGIAIYPEDAENADLLLKHADTAMYEAKKVGRNNFQFFHKTYIEKIKDKHQLELGLRNAMPKDELSLFYQPQYETRSRKLAGAEVLIRWRQQQQKMIPPDLFIPIAEEVGLIIPIGKWILETACAQQKSWLERGYKIPYVAVNISARQFLDPKFIETVEEALVKTQLEAQYLELEITESMLIGDTRKIELQLDRLKKMGIKIALDDFGTGYSSLSYLKKFPIDILKIDKSFIRELTAGSKDSQIACAIIEMGHSLGQKIVAEGVENEMQYQFLRERKCDYLQGYYFSKPLPTHEMTRLLEGLAH